MVGPLRKIKSVCSLKSKAFNKMKNLFAVIFGIVLAVLAMASAAPEPSPRNSFGGKPPIYRPPPPPRPRPPMRV